MEAEILFSVSSLPVSNKNLICEQKHEKSNCYYSKYLSVSLHSFFLHVV